MATVRPVIADIPLDREPGEGLDSQSRTRYHPLPLIEPIGVEDAVEGVQRRAARIRVDEESSRLRITGEEIGCRGDEGQPAKGTSPIIRIDIILIRAREGARQCERDRLTETIVEVDTSTLTPVSIVPIDDPFLPHIPEGGMIVDPPRTPLS